MFVVKSDPVCVYALRKVRRHLHSSTDVVCAVTMRATITPVCSCGYKIGCFLSLFDVWCDNELVCFHMHGTRGMAESGTS